MTTLKNGVGKRFVNSIIFSVVVTIVTTVGTFTCKGPGDAGDGQMVVVQHPDGCYLESPKPLAEGLSANGDIVNVKVGRNKFEFMCDGNDVTIFKVVKEGDMTIKVDPDQSGDPR